jgi:hypothetical protein
VKRCSTDRIRPLPRPSKTTSRRSLTGFAIGVVLALAAQLGLASSASARIIDHGPLEHEDHYTVKNSCDVPGFTTKVDIVYRGHYIVRAKGKERLPYLAERWIGKIRFTNVDTGKYVTISDHYTQTDFSLVDNGDGTTTGRNRGRYHKVMRDAHGRKLTSSHVRDVSRWVVDNGGTPQDRSDDEELEWEVLKESGHHADFCAATVAAIAD